MGSCVSTQPVFLFFVSSCCLEDLTGDENITMKYRKQKYLEDIVLEHHLQLVGWPQGIPFANVSDLTGGIPIIERLIGELQSGQLHFRRVSRTYAARLWVRNVTPGRCPPSPVWLGRSDVKKHRVRTVKLARYVLTGPKTPALVADSPAYDESDEDLGGDEILESEGDSGMETEDEILEWSDS